MANWFCKIVVLCAAILAPMILLDTNRAEGQLIREPSIEGVSYAEIAQWQSNYGGGPFLRRGYGPAYCGPPPFVDDYCTMDEPPVVKKPKQKRKSQPSGK